MESPIFFTIVAKNYISYAKVLAESTLKHHPNAKFYVFLSDEPSNLVEDFDLYELISIFELELPNFQAFTFRYDIMELSTAIKPYAFDYIFKKKNAKYAIYLDPDIYVMSELSDAIDLLKNQNKTAILTPHLLSQIQDNYLPNENTMLQVGAYNLGFIAIANNFEGKKLVTWWKKRLERGAFVDLENGLFTDQKWADLMPSLFEGIHILRHPGYNYAYWNLSQRKLTLKNKKYYVEGKKLVFFHFSGVNPLKPNIFSKHQNRHSIKEIGLAKKIFDEYIEKQLRFNYRFFAKMDYAFNHFSDNSFIRPEFRFYFNKFIDKNNPKFNPFSSLNSKFFRRKEQGMILSKGAYGFYLKNKNFHFQYNLKNKKDAMKFFIFYNSSFFNQIQHSYIKDTISQFKFDTLERIKRNPSFFNSIKKFKLISILGRVLFYSYPFPSDSRTVRLKPLCIIGYPKGDFGVAQNLRGLASALNTNINFDIFDLGTSGLHSELDSSCKNITSSINSNFLIFCVNADSTREAIKRTQTNDNQFYKVGYWFWELSTFPDVWKVAADSLDEIWAPTEFIFNALKKFTTKPIFHIPVVVEPKITRKYMRSEFNLPDGVFLFLFSYDFHSFQQRKNPDAVIESFIKAFPSAQKNVGLVIKTINSEKYPESLLSLNKFVAKDSRIHLINKNLSRDQMYGLITVCDSYVSLHRAEGFGLGLAEAMFFGKPVIGTAYSGNLDFMNLDNSCMVNYKLIDVKSGEYPHFKGQKWADPDISHAAYFMKLLVGDKKFNKIISRNGERFIKERHNSKTISKILSQRLDFKNSSQVI